MIKRINILFTLFLILSFLMTSSGAIFAEDDIFKLVKDGNTDKVKRMLDENAGLIKSTTAEGQGLLHFAVRENKKETAQLLIKKGIEESGKSYDLYFYLGDLYYFKEYYNEAMINYSKGLNISPDDAGILYKLATCYEKSDQTFNALTALKKSIAKKPDNYSPYLLAYTIYFKQGRLDMAEEYLIKGTKLNPSAGISNLINLGHTYYNKGHIAQAVKIYKKAYELDPTNIGIASLIGNATGRIKRRE